MVLLVAIGSVSVVSSNLNSGARMAVYRGGDGLKPRLLVSTAILLTALALVACSGGEGPDTVEPAVEATLPTTVAATDTAEATAAAEPIVEIEPEATATAVPDSEGTVTDTESVVEKNTVPSTTSPVLSGPFVPLPTPEPEPGPRLDTLPWVRFPDNIAILAHYYVPSGKGAPNEVSLARVYWRDGRLVRDLLFSQFDHGSALTIPEDLPFSPPLTMPVAARRFFSVGGEADASSLHLIACVEGRCLGRVMSGLEDDEYLPRYARYESLDGGITWEIMLGEVLSPAEVRRTWEATVAATKSQDPSCPEWYQCLMLPDGRLLLLRGYDPDELVGPEGAATGFYFYHDRSFNVRWPTILNPETGEEWPVRLPYDVLAAGAELAAIAIQQGPFLQVTGVDDCLPILAEPSPDAEELACMAERVLLTDMGEAVQLADLVMSPDPTVGGFEDAWHRVRTPAGIEGWADSRYLE